MVEGDQDFGFEHNELGVLLTKRNATFLEFLSDSPSTIFFCTCVGREEIIFSLCRGAA